VKQGSWAHAEEKTNARAKARKRQATIGTPVREINSRRRAALSVRLRNLGSRPQLALRTRRRPRVERRLRAGSRAPLALSPRPHGPKRERQKHADKHRQNHALERAERWTGYGWEMDWLWLRDGLAMAERWTGWENKRPQEMSGATGDAPLFQYAGKREVPGWEERAGGSPFSPHKLGTAPKVPVRHTRKVAFSSQRRCTRCRRHAQWHGARGWRGQENEPTPCLSRACQATAGLSWAAQRPRGQAPSASLTVNPCLVAPRRRSPHARRSPNARRSPRAWDGGRRRRRLARDGGANLCRFWPQRAGRPIVRPG